MSRTACLAIACLALLGSPAQAADSSVAPDEVAERIVRGSDMGVVEILRAGGTLVPVLFALSAAALTLAVYLAIECRPGRVFPAALHAEVVSRLAARDWAGAMGVIEKDSSLYARAVRAALRGEERAPAEEMLAAALASSGRDASNLRTRTGYLAQLAAVAALVGLLGTVLGMLQAFGAGAREEFRPVLLYAAVMKAMVTSLMGIGIASFAVIAYFAIGSRLERALADAGYAIDELIRALRSGGRK